MKQTRKESGSTVFAALLGIAGIWVLAGGLVLAPAPAAAVEVGAEITVDAECVETCMTDLRVCLADARQEFLQCSLEGGCVELAATMKLTCKPDKTASVCLEARAEYNECIQPCRAELRQDVKVCQNTGLSCLHDECGLSDLPEQCSRVSVAVN